MNRIFFRSLLATVFSTLLCLGSPAVFAEDHEEKIISEDVVVDEKESVLEEVTNSLTQVIGKYPFDDSYYLQRIHHDGYYHLVGWMGADGSTAVLHDGSEWSIEPKGRQKVLYWVQSDEIFIKPCISWFSSYRYVLHNRTQNHVVEANLKTPPVPAGAYTFLITNIEPYQRLITLSDNTVWQLNPDVKLYHWQIGQRIFVGVNNKWREAACPHILINVDLYGQPFSPATYYGCFTN